VQLSFDGWPFRQPWDEKLDVVKDTHNINPLPAYDLNHSTITPKDYEQCLLGTIVELHATLIHYLIGKKGTTLVADLQDAACTLGTAPESNKEEVNGRV
jgi:hypothetical protein